MCQRRRSLKCGHSAVVNVVHHSCPHGGVKKQRLRRYACVAATGTTRGAWVTPVFLITSTYVAGYSILHSTTGEGFLVLFTLLFLERYLLDKN